MEEIESKQSNAPKLKAQLFICITCGSKPEEAALLRSELKNHCREVYGKDKVRVTASKCLGQCQEAISAVMYPSGTWYAHLKPSDKQFLLSEIEKETKK